MQDEEFEQEETSTDNTYQIMVQDSKERVALELFKIVYDEANDMPDDLSRHELLTLYNQCYNSVHGVDPEEIFSE